MNLYVMDQLTAKMNDEIVLALHMTTDDLALLKILLARHNNQSIRAMYEMIAQVGHEIITPIC